MYRKCPAQGLAHKRPINFFFFKVVGPLSFLLKRIYFRKLLDRVGYVYIRNIQTCGEFS